MHLRHWAILAIIVSLGMSGRARAGVYNSTADLEEERLSHDFTQFRQTLIRLRSIAMEKVEVDNPVRRRYRFQADLAGRANLAGLSVREKTDLGAVLIRRGQYHEAIQLLMPLARQEPDNIRLQCNLATAYHLSGELLGAGDILSHTFRTAWPADWSKLPEARQRALLAVGWTDAEYGYYRNAEKHYEKLLKLRRRDAAGKKGQDLSADALSADALFVGPTGPVRFVNEAGAFEPGKIAAAEKAKLPPDALDVVQQLLVWLPHDQRLYRLLGELYNARGKHTDVRAAYLIFNELAESGPARTREVVERQQALKEYVDALPDETYKGVNVDVEQQLAESEQKDAGPPFTWRTLLAGAGVGFLAGLLTAWQVREFRRRQLAGRPRAAAR